MPAEGTRVSRLHQAGAVLRLVRGKTRSVALFTFGTALRRLRRATSSLAYSVCRRFTVLPTIAMRNCTRGRLSRLRDYLQDLHTQSFASRHLRNRTGRSVNFNDLVVSLVISFLCGLAGHFVSTDFGFAKFGKLRQ